MLSPRSYAAAASTNLPTEATPMEVDKPAGSPAQRSATPLCSNQSLTNTFPAAIPSQATSVIQTTPANTPDQGATPTPLATNQSAPLVSPSSSSLVAADAVGGVAINNISTVGAAVLAMFITITPFLYLDSPLRCCCLFVVVVVVGRNFLFPLVLFFVFLDLVLCQIDGQEEMIGPTTYRSYRRPTYK